MKPDGNESKNKKSTIVANLVVAFIVLGFGYYKLIYSKSTTQTMFNKTGNSIGLKDSDMITDRNFTYGILYAGENNLNQIKGVSDSLIKDFQLNGLLVDLSYINGALPEEVAKLDGMDFQYKVFFGAITNDPDRLTHEVILASKECHMRPRLYVSKSKSYQKIADLIGKKIILTDAITLPNTMYDFLIKSKLDGNEIYKALKPAYVFKSVALNAFDAILINTFVNFGEPSNSALISPEELDQSFREIPFDYAETPCRGIFASKALDKKVVDKFISIHTTPSDNSELADKYYKKLKRFTPEEMQKIISGFDWEKIDKMKPTIKFFNQEFMDSLGKH